LAGREKVVPGPAGPDGIWPVPATRLKGWSTVRGGSMPHHDLRTLGPAERGRRLTIVVDGEELDAYEGESIAAALLAAGRRTTRWTERTGEPRGYFCGMGVCHDCLVEVDGQPGVRACMTPVRDGLRVARQRGAGEWRVSG
jgi:hypothetical protein